MVLQTYQNFIEMTSNVIYIVTLGVGCKCPCKIHLNTQCPPPPDFQTFLHPFNHVALHKNTFFATSCFSAFLERRSYEENPKNSRKRNQSPGVEMFNEE